MIYLKNYLFRKYWYAEISPAAGLSAEEVHSRQKKYGLNIIHKKKINLLVILLRQFYGKSFDYYFGNCHTFFIFSRTTYQLILYFRNYCRKRFSGLWNEYSAERTVDNLLRKISPTALVVRNNEKMEIPVMDLTIGDIVLLSQGSITPQTSVLRKLKIWRWMKSALTGESKTVLKSQSVKDRTQRHLRL